MSRRTGWISIGTFGMLFIPAVLLFFPGHVVPPLISTTPVSRILWEYDSRKISYSRMREVILFAPPWMKPTMDTAVPIGYMQSDKRAYLTRSFQLIRDKQLLLNHLETAWWPRELQPAVNWHLNRLRFSLYMALMHYDYVKTGDSGVFSRQFQQLSPAIICKLHLQRITHAKTLREKRYWLYLMSARMEDAFFSLKSVSSYPTADWNRFLKHYHIQSRETFAGIMPARG